MSTQPTSSSSSSSQYLAATYTTLISATIIVTTRLYIHHSRPPFPKWSDSLILLALLLSLTTISISTYSISQGLGKNLSELTAGEAARATMLNYISTVPNIIGTTIAKISITLTLWSVVSSSLGQRDVAMVSTPTSQSSDATTNKPRSTLPKLILIITSTLPPLYQTIFIIFTFAQCRPVSGLWDIRISSGCSDRTLETQLALGSSILNVLMDLLLTIFVLVLMWKRKLTKGARVGGAFIACTGLFAMACGIIHTIDMNTLGSPAEALYSTADLQLWSILEHNLTIIAACIFSLRVLFRPLFAPPPARVLAKETKPNVGEFYNQKLNASSETQVQPQTSTPPRAAQSNAPPIPTTPPRTPTRIPRIVVGDPDSIDARLARLSESLASVTSPTSARKSPRYSPRQSPSLSLFPSSPSIRRVDSRPRVNSEGISNVYVYAPRRVEVKRKPVSSEPGRSSNLAPPRGDRPRVQGPRNMGLSDRRGIARPFEVNVPRARDVDRRIRDVNLQQERNDA